jgi:hypothetical protein
MVSISHHAVPVLESGGFIESDLKTCQNPIVQYLNFLLKSLSLSLSLSK